MIPKFPSYIFIDDNSLQRATTSNVLRSEMEVGAQKTRPIQSKPMFQTSMSISMRTERLIDFRTWFNNDLKFGAQWFTLNDPFDGTIRRFRFIEYDLTWKKTGNLLQSEIKLEAYDEL